MNSPLPSSISSEIFSNDLAPDQKKTVSWPAIFAGLIGALGCQVLFMLLGAGLGFAIYTPLSDDHPVANLGAGAMIVHGISAVFSLWFGGWITGRFTPVHMRNTGWLHGLVMWCACTVAGVILVSSSAAWALGDLSKVVGGGLSAAGKPLAAAARTAADSTKTSGLQSVNSFVDEAVSDRPAGGAAISVPKAKRDVGAALTRLFNPSTSTNPAENKAAVVKALTESAGVSDNDANRMVNDWTASYDKTKADLEAAKNEAEAKARVAAEKTANALSIFSFCAFGAFLIGAVAASFGGKQGAIVATMHESRLAPAL